MQENDKFFDTKQYKVCPKMEIPTTKYLADYLYVVHEDVPFRYYRKVSDRAGYSGGPSCMIWFMGMWYMPI